MSGCFSSAASASDVSCRKAQMLNPMWHSKARSVRLMFELILLARIHDRRCKLFCFKIDVKYDTLSVIKCYGTTPPVSW